MWSLEGQLCRGDSATRRPPPPVKAVRVCSLACGPVEKTHSITFLTDSPAELTQGTAGSRTQASLASHTTEVPSRRLPLLHVVWRPPTPLRTPLLL